MPAKLVFIMPEEFFDWLNEVRVKLEMKVILEVYKKGRFLWDGERDSITDIPRSQVQVYLADGESFIEYFIQEKDIYARQGWVHMAELPEFDSNKLLSIQIDVKETWYNSEMREFQKINLAKRNFGRIWRLLLKKLNFGVFAKNRVFYNDIGYTNGARNWFANGGKLQQSGVKNSEFFID